MTKHLIMILYFSSSAKYCFSFICWAGFLTGSISLVELLYFLIFTLVLRMYSFFFAERNVRSVFSYYTGCSLKIVFFPYNFVIFLTSASSAAALVFYLPGVCTHTDTEGKQRMARVWNIFKSSKKTQYLMNTLYIIEQISWQKN